jgi:hypothetical protein
VLAEVAALSPIVQMQLLLPPPVGDAVLHMLGGSPPASSQTRAVAHRHPRLDLRPQLAFWIVPPPPRRGAKIGAVGLSVQAALPGYRKKWRRQHKPDLLRRMAAEGHAVEAPAARPPRKDRHRSRPKRVKDAPVAIIVAAPIAVTEGWAIDTWDWAADGRLVDGGEGLDGWAAWRGGIVEEAMVRREAQVQAEMAAKQAASGEPARPKQVVKRSKAQAAAAATAVLMAGKPGQSGKKARAKAAAAGATA